MKNRIKKEQKVWGWVTHIFSSDQAAVSCLEVKAGYRCSKHFHQERANLFAVQEGVVCVEMWEGSKRTLNVLRAGDVFTVPSMQWHRFRVMESGRLVEVYWPDMGGGVRMEDIVREDEGGSDDLEELKKEIMCLNPDQRFL